VLSLALTVRLGFRQEGVRRQAERVGGYHHDLALYAVLADEWHG
jgi:RimJ/RimL family protein N-acetyltransferase